MKVSLISYTPDALNLLLGTKNTRIDPSATPPAEWSEEKKAEHLEYMRDTIKSSWEFVDYVFKIEGVTRAFTHQLVRTRTGSYAEQSLRATDVSANEVMLPESVVIEGWEETWDITAKCSIDLYKILIEPHRNIPLQDARGILPLNITTSIQAKFNLRTLHEMAKVRLCTRTQGEYQAVFRAMRSEVIAVHPWAEDFINVHCVSEGTCAFPRYGKKECPVYLESMDMTAVKNGARHAWESISYESNPGVKR